MREIKKIKPNEAFEKLGKDDNERLYKVIEFQKIVATLDREFIEKIENLVAENKELTALAGISIVHRFQIFENDVSRIAVGDQKKLKKLFKNLKLKINK